MAWYKCASGGEGIPLVTKSGSIVEYEDSVGGVPINNLVADITPIQENGTPTLSNPLSVSGFTEGIIGVSGLEFWDSTTNYLKQYSLSDAASDDYVSCDGFIDIFGGQNYIFKHDNGNNVYQVQYLRFYDDSKEEITSGRITSYEQNGIDFSAPQNARYMRFQFYNANDVSVASISALNISIRLKINETKQQTPFVKTNRGESDFGQTVLGGTWKVSEGKVNSNWIEVDLGTFNWYKYPDSKLGLISNASRFTIQPNAYGGNNYTVVCHALATCFHPDTVQNTYNNLVDHSFSFSQSNTCYIYDSSFVNMTAEEIKASLSGVKLYYRSNASTEISVEPVLLETIQGENNVFANTGDLDAVFYKSSVSNLAELVEQSKALGAIT